MNHRPLLLATAGALSATVGVAVWFSWTGQYSQPSEQGHWPDTPTIVGEATAAPTLRNASATAPQRLASSPTDKILAAAAPPEPPPLRYPSIAHRLHLNGIPLAEISIGELDGEQMAKLGENARRLAGEIEEQLLQTQFGWRESLLDREAALERAAEAPNVYFANPPSSRYGLGQGRWYYEVPGDPGPELRELQQLSLELTSSPQYESRMMTSVEKQLGQEWNAIASWKEDPVAGARIGLGASGNEIVRIEVTQIGAP